MAFGLFRKTASFENGNSNTYAKTAYLMTGKLTQSATTHSANPLNMYDRDGTTYYRVGYQQGDQFVQWEFNSLKVFKNLYFYVKWHNDSGASADIIKLQSSVNGTDWTDQDTHSVAAAATDQVPLFAYNIKARFVKLLFDNSNGSGTGDIYNAEAVI